MLNLHDRPINADMASTAPGDTCIFSGAAPPQDFDLSDAHNTLTDRRAPSESSRSESGESQLQDQETRGSVDEMEGALLQSLQVDGIRLYSDEPDFSAANSVKLYSDEPEALVIALKPDEEAEFARSLTIMSGSQEEERVRQREAEFGHANVGVA